MKKDELFNKSKKRVANYLKQKREEKELRENCDAQSMPTFLEDK